MNINNTFPSDYLKATDLQGKAVKVQMSHVDVKKIGNDEKPILYFLGKQKGIVLNKTNAMVISSAYGPETEGWNGKPLEVYPDKTQFNGQVVDCIRVRVPAPVADPTDEPPF